MKKMLWTRTGKTKRNKSGQLMCECICNCGLIKFVAAYSYGLSSFSCAQCGFTKRGLSNTRLHKTWDKMISRCTDKNCKSFADYGGRGIEVCDEWRTNFFAFRAWALISGYSDELTIDRIDNSKSYCPDNCKWSDRHTQNRNKRSNIYVEINGKRMILKDWCREFNLSYKNVHKRIKYLKWNAVKALTTKTNMPFDQAPMIQSEQDA